jgi:hypothetical protein
MRIIVWNPERIFRELFAQRSVIRGDTQMIRDQLSAAKTLFGPRMVSVAKPQSSRKSGSTRNRDSRNFFAKTKKPLCSGLLVSKVWEMPLVAVRNLSDGRSSKISLSLFGFQP